MARSRIRPDASARSRKSANGATVRRATAPAGRSDDKRRRLIESALERVYRLGYHRSTLVEIAAGARVPPGNVFYYFKTKEEIGQALVAERARQFAEIRAGWDRIKDPRKRLAAFVDMSLANRSQLERSGCPIGSLCTELRKQDDDPVADAAAALFTDFLAWLARQFVALGRPAAESRDLAVHLLSALEGATLLTHSLRSPTCLEREAQRLKIWLKSI
jgi:TetR/AcrR family transcriptional repressor of nem operon